MLNLTPKIGFPISRSQTKCYKGGWKVLKYKFDVNLFFPKSFVLNFKTMISVVLLSRLEAPSR